MHYLDYCHRNNPGINENITPNENTPLIRHNHNKYVCYNYTILDYVFFLLELLGLIFLFISHTIAIVSSSYNHKITGTLDIIGGIFIFINGYYKSNILLIIFMILWITMGVTQIIDIYDFPNKDNTTKILHE